MRATIKGIVINCAEDAYNLVHKRLSRKEQEDFLCLVLDTKHNVVGPAVHVARGTLMIMNHYNGSSITAHCLTKHVSCYHIVVGSDSYMSFAERGLI